MLSSPGGMTSADAESVLMFFVESLTLVARQQGASDGELKGMAGQ